MSNIKIKEGYLVLWEDSGRTLLLDLDELTKAFINDINPHTGNNISETLMKRIGLILRYIGGDDWAYQLRYIKNYRNLSGSKLQNIRETQTKLGSGKYATVFMYKNFAVKTISHKFYKNLPRIDGTTEAKVLDHLLKHITYRYYTPNIVTLFQFTTNKRHDYIVMEKCDKTFWNIIQENPSERVLKGIILQVLFTLLVLQTCYPGFRHNDLKTDNVLLNVSERNKDITLMYGKHFWTIPKDIPLVKLSDFDYANIPKVTKNPKVDTPHSRSFGCTSRKCDHYDVHLFLNSIYNHRRKLPESIVLWLEKQLPSQVRGMESKHVKYARLKRPEQWVKKIKSPKNIILTRFMSEFRINKATLPVWGMRKNDFRPKN